MSFTPPPAPAPAGSASEAALRDEVVDLAVVGAGIVGLAHAAQAAWRGQTVAVLERDARAVGASIRNFGHACITAQHGRLHEVAQASRRGWLRAGREAGLDVAESGAVVVARSEVELQVLRELGTERGDQVRLLDAGGTAEAVARDRTDGILGGALLTDDLRVDPRTTVARLAAWLGRYDGVSVHFSTPVAAVDPGGGVDGGEPWVTVRSPRGIVRAKRVVVCVGHDVDYLYPRIAEEHQLQRCTLAMALTEPAPGPEVRPAVLSATSMLRYDAFTAQPSAGRLRAEAQDRYPDLLEMGANVMCTQRPDGSIIAGDSHDYDLTPEPFVRAGTDERLQREVERLIDRKLSVAERWQGVYASSPIAPVLTREAGPGVVVCSVTSGVGMTLSFGLAEHNLDSGFEPLFPARPTKGTP